MTAHIRVPGLDDAPATLSRAVIDGSSASELGFDGLVITDALEMRAVSGTVGVEEGAVLALAGRRRRAAASGTTSARGASPVQGALVDAVAPRAARRGAARRGGRPRRRLGGGAREPARTASPARGRAGGGAARARDEATLALDRPPLVVELLPEPSIAAGPSVHGLADLLGAEVARLGENEDASAFAAAHQENQLVVVVQDAHRHPWQQDAARTILDRAEDAVLVEIGLPVWQPDGVTYVATRGRGRVNLEAAAELLLPG